MGHTLLEEAGFSGMNRDISPWAMKPGMLWDANNFLFDRPGVARKRMPYNTPSALGSVAGFAAGPLGFAYSTDGASTIEELYGYNARDGAVRRITQATGANASVYAPGLAVNTPGRSCRHFGFVVFPWALSSVTAPRGAVFLAGATTTTTYASTTLGSVTSGNATVTLAGGSTANLQVGAIVTITTVTQIYWGRVVSVPSATTFTCWPVPTFTDAAVPIGGITGAPQILEAIGGTCCCSFQNRLLFGNTWGNGPVTFDRQVNYSFLPTETSTAGVTFSGALFVKTGSGSAFNSFSLPGADPIIGMEPINDGELLILTSGRPWILTGQLTSQTSTFAPGITADLSPIPIPANCLSDHSIQSTPIGVIWAGSEGIWVYGGRGNNTGSGRLPVDITLGKIHTYWRDLVVGTGFAIHGAVQVRGHYILTGISNSVTFCLVYNFANGEWSTFSNFDIFSGVVQPSNPAVAWALRWWDKNSAPPNFTGGQTVLPASMFARYTQGTNVNDPDGSAISMLATTRAIGADLQTQKIMRRISVRYQMSAISAAATVFAESRVDPGDVYNTAPYATLGFLSNTQPTAVSAVSNATPIQITTAAAHGLQTDDTVDIFGTAIANANGRWRIKVLSGTTFTLNQSTAGGVGGAQGEVKHISEQEFIAQAVQPGQALIVAIQDTAAVDNFELHGIRASALEMPLGMAKG
jgi:hypothetical protein